MTNISNFAQVKAHTIACLQLAQKLYPSFNVDIPYLNITSFPKGRAAGSAQMQHIRGHYHFNIRYNREAIENHLDEMLNDTVPHEVAHIVVMYLNRLNPVRAHGNEWKRMVTTLGGKAERCHTLKLSKAKVQSKYNYKATCGTEVTVSSCMHKKIQQGQVRVLRSTNGKLVANCYVGRKC